MNGAQVSAFQANSGIAPSAMATVLVGAVFAVLLVWGVTRKMGTPRCAARCQIGANIAPFLCDQNSAMVEFRVTAGSKQ